MKNIALFLVFAVLLLGACSNQSPEDFIGEGSPVPADKAPPAPEQDAASPPQEAAPEASQPELLLEEVKEFKITAKQFSFEPETIEVNKGDKVRLIVTSIDVPHGFSVREYGINERLDVGKPVTIEFTADKEGSFTAFCSVICGAGHSNMKGKLIVR